MRVFWLAAHARPIQVSQLVGIRAHVCGSFGVRERVEEAKVRVQLLHLGRHPVVQHPVPQQPHVVLENIVSHEQRRLVVSHSLEYKLERARHRRVKRGQVVTPQVVRADPRDGLCARMHLHVARQTHATQIVRPGKEIQNTQLHHVRRARRKPRRLGVDDKRVVLVAVLGVAGPVARIEVRLDARKEGSPPSAVPPAVVPGARQQRVDLGAVVADNLPQFAHEKVREQHGLAGVVLAAALELEGNART